jgi:hypothetical protein
MNVSLAPTWRHATARIVMLLVAVVVVACTMYAMNGAPSQGRRVRQNEIARFAPTATHGLGQFLGETGLVVLAAWIAQRGLRVRL